MPERPSGMRYVTSRRDKDGSERWYWQRRGYALERLPDDELERHARAKELNDGADRGELAKAEPRRDKRDLNYISGVIFEYQKHESFTGLAPGTQAYYSRILNELDEMFGERRTSAIDQTICIDYLDAIEQIGERRKHRAVLRTLLNRAVYHRKLPFNPTNGIEISLAPVRDRYLEEAEIVRFIKGCRNHPTHGRMVYDGFMLLLFTVQRPGDMLKMGHKQYTGHSIKLRQKKTKKWVEVPIHPQLQVVLDRILARNDGAEIFMTHNGLEVSEKTFNFRFNEVKRSVGLLDIQARDLRRTAAVRMGEAGTEIQDIAACAGWGIDYTKKILETYLPRTFKMAERGVARMPNVSLTYEAA